MKRKSKSVSSAAKFWLARNFVGAVCAFCLFQTIVSFSLTTNLGVNAQIEVPFYPLKAQIGDAYSNSGKANVADRKPTNLRQQFEATTPMHLFVDRGNKVVTSLRQRKVKDKQHDRRGAPKIHHRTQEEDINSLSQNTPFVIDESQPLHQRFVFINSNVTLKCPLLELIPSKYFDGINTNSLNIKWFFSKETLIDTSKEDNVAQQNSGEKRDNVDDEETEFSDGERDSEVDAKLNQGSARLSSKWRTSKNLFDGDNKRQIENQIKFGPRKAIDNDNYVELTNLQELSWNTNKDGDLSIPKVTSELAGIYKCEINNQSSKLLLSVGELSLPSNCLTQTMGNCKSHLHIDRKNETSDDENKLNASGKPIDIWRDERLSGANSQSFVTSSNKQYNRETLAEANRDQTKLAAAKDSEAAALAAGPGNEPIRTEENLNRQRPVAEIKLASAVHRKQNKNQYQDENDDDDDDDKTYQSSAGNDLGFGDGKRKVSGNDLLVKFAEFGAKESTSLSSIGAEDSGMPANFIKQPDKNTKFSQIRLGSNANESQPSPSSLLSLQLASSSWQDTNANVVNSPVAVANYNLSVLLPNLPATTAFVGVPENEPSLYPTPEVWYDANLSYGRTNEEEKEREEKVKEVKVKEYDSFPATTTTGTGYPFGISESATQTTSKQQQQRSQRSTKTGNELGIKAYSSSTNTTNPATKNSSLFESNLNSSNELSVKLTANELDSINNFSLPAEEQTEAESEAEVVNKQQNSIAMQSLAEGSENERVYLSADASKWAGSRPEEDLEPEATISGKRQAFDGKEEKEEDDGEEGESYYARDFKFSSMSLGASSVIRPRKVQVHALLNEAIISRDLKNIPGFFYNKLKLFCPINEQNLDIRNFIEPLISYFCPTNNLAFATTTTQEANKDCNATTTTTTNSQLSKQTNMTTTTTATNLQQPTIGQQSRRINCKVETHSHSIGQQKNVSEMRIAKRQRRKSQFDCRELASRLILSRLFARNDNNINTNANPNNGQQSSFCSSTQLLDLVWLKDNVEVKFSGDSLVGVKPTSAKNAKLINIAADSIQCNNNTGQLAEGKESSYLSTTTTTTIQDSQDTSEHNFGFSCPLASRQLEVDGLGDNSFGKYTCALRLSANKLNKLIYMIKEELKQKPLAEQNNNRQSFKSKGSAKNDVNSNSSSNINANSGYNRCTCSIVSCCNCFGTASLKTNNSRKQRKSKMTTTWMNNKRRDNSFDRFDDMLMQTKESTKSNYYNNLGENIFTKYDSSLKFKIDTLKAMINESIDDNQVLYHLQESLAFATLQLQTQLYELETFSIKISEKPAERCNFWNSIGKANEAFAQHRLVSFMNLKQKSMAEHQFNIDSPKTKPQSSLQTNLDVLDLSKLKTQADTQPNYSSLRVNPNFLSIDNKQQHQNLNPTIDNRKADEIIVKRVDELSPENRFINNYWHVDNESGSESNHESADTSEQHTVNSQQLGTSLFTSWSNWSQKLARSIHNAFIGYNKHEEESVYAQKPQITTVDVENLSENKHLNEGNKAEYFNTNNNNNNYNYKVSNLVEKQPTAKPNNENLNYQYDNSIDAKTAIPRLSNAGYYYANNNNTNFDDEPIAYAKQTSTTSNQADKLDKQTLKLEPTSTTSIDTNLLPPLALPLNSVYTNEFQSLTTNEIHKGQSIFETGNDVSSINGFKYGVNYKVVDSNPITEYSSIDSNSFHQNMSRFRRDVGNENNINSKSQNIGSINGKMNDKDDYNLNEQKNDNSNLMNQDDNVVDTNNETVIDDKISQLESNNLAYDDQNDSDDSIMWTASKYLYMHMRALTSSSLFGAKVDVEWSNEDTFRVSGNTLESQSQPVSLPSLSITTSTPSTSSSTQDNDICPSATIDVIAGQNLHLECTAQAIGRLPTVNWYKLIDQSSIQSNYLKSKLVKIDNSYFWPLTDIDLLYKQNYDSLKAKKTTNSFVASQTLTTFNNLSNQTFTVINSLHLTQYNDNINEISYKQGNGNQKDDLLLGYNIYACLVKADFRRSYARIAINLRMPLNRLSLMNDNQQLGKARDSFIKASAFNSNQALSIARDNPTFMFLTSGNNHISYSPKFGWTPIKNSTFNHQNYKQMKFITPTLVGMTTILLNISAILIYLTFKSCDSSEPLESIDTQSSQSLHTQATGAVDCCHLDSHNCNYDENVIINDEELDTSSCSNISHVVEQQQSSIAINMIEMKASDRQANLKSNEATFV